MKLLWVMHRHCAGFNRLSQMDITRFNLPRGPGAHALRFCCGPLDSSD